MGVGKGCAWIGVVGWCVWVVWFFGLSLCLFFPRQQSSGNIYPRHFVLCGFWGLSFLPTLVLSSCGWFLPSVFSLCLSFYLGFAVSSPAPPPYHHFFVLVYVCYIAPYPLVLLLLMYISTRLALPSPYPPVSVSMLRRVYTTAAVYESTDSKT